MHKIEVFGRSEGGKVEELTISDDKKTISYKLNIPNSHKDVDTGVPLEEQDHLALEMVLNAELLVLPDGYSLKSDTEVASDIIKNAVKITPVPYQEYDVPSSDDYVITTPRLLVEQYNFWKSVSGSSFGPGDTMLYSFQIINTGETPIAVKDGEGNTYKITDKLPSYVYMSEGQIDNLEKLGGTYDASTNTVTIVPSTEAIAVGAKVELGFWVTLKDAKTLDALGLKKGDTVKNIGQYKGADSTPALFTYKTAELNVEKTAQDASGDELVQNGEEVTYTITVTNTTKYECIIPETITDTLPKGLTFKSMTVGDSTLIASGDFTFHDSTTGCGSDHTGSFTIDGQDLSWDIGCVQPNESIEVTYVCSVDTDQLDSRTEIENTATITTGDTSTNTIGVDYPIKLDKTVAQDTTVGYPTETVFDYTITVTNDENYPSAKDDLVLEDQLPVGMLPYNCKLIQTSKADATKTTEISWEDFVAGTYDTTNYTYTTTLATGGLTATVENVDGAVKLVWNIGTLGKGKTITISYQAQMILTQEQIDDGTSFKFTNTASIDDITKDVTVTGGKMVGSIDIGKQFLWYYNGTKWYGRLGEVGEDERWDIEFVLTGVDPKGNTIVFEDGSTQKVISMQDFKTNVYNSGSYYTYSCKIDKLPVGTYTLAERNYDVEGQVAYPEFGVISLENENDVTYSDFSGQIIVAENRTSEVWVNNKYYEKDRVNLQKSVYEIAVEGENGTWTSVPEKYLFAIDDDADTKTMVVYNITVSATGGWDATILSLKDKLPEGMKFVGVYNNNNYTDRSSFKAGTVNLAISIPEYELIDPNSLAQEYVSIRTRAAKITNTTYDETTNEVTFFFDFGSDTDTSTNPYSYKLNAGEAISFLVLCEVEDSVVAGQQLTNTAELVASGIGGGLSDSPEYKTVHTPYDANQNNGDAVVVDETDGVWTIESSVTVVPENTIVPGIEKNATGYILSGKKAADEIAMDPEKEINIPSNSAVKWEVKLYNNGTEDMVSYKVEDVVTPDFHLMTKEEAEEFNITAPFSYQIYSYDGKEIGEAHNISETVWATVTNGSSISEFTFDFSDDTYEIPAGGYGVLTMYTNNIKQSNKIYRNTATILPEQEFVANKVIHGELTKDSDGKYIGVMAADEVYALGEYASVSWKTITEKADADNTAKGTGSKNYISVDLDSQYVTYTNNIKNISANNFSNFVVIDLMPTKNDTGVVNRSDIRGSEFSVLYNGEMSVKVVNAQGEVVGTPDYTVEFSSKTGFTQKDFAGAASASWHSEWKPEDVSFRVVLEDGFMLSPQETLVIQYDGKIEAGATPGAIAWNSFGYQYYSSGHDTPMRAEPPKVGVMIPTVPIIQKEVVDSYDKVQERDPGIEFTFVLWDKQAYDESASDAVNEANAKLCEFKVCQGGYLELSKLKDADGNLFKLQNGREYMITEVNIPDGYQLAGIGENGGTLKESYSFVYYDNKDINILVRNEVDNYQMELPATGGIGTTGFKAAGGVMMLLTVLLYGYSINNHKKKESTK